MNTNMKTITVEAYPYAHTTGELKVPEDLTPSQMREYVEKHWGDVKFNEPSLDYKGTEYHLYDESGEEI